MRASPRWFRHSILCLMVLPLLPPAAAGAEPGWRAGTARVDVTPSFPIRLTGYASRSTEATQTAQKLWAKALALDGGTNGPALLLTLDNCGITTALTEEVFARVARESPLRRERFALCVSHTHSGPCLTGWAPNIFARDLTPEEQARIDRYTRELADKLATVALESLRRRQPARLAWAQGRTGFARNRRVVAGGTAHFGDNAAGPVDHALPVLKVEDSAGKLVALVANYACHCTTLGGEFNQFHGDWSGCAQEFLERDHPGATAFITIGCGADANPAPRGTLALAQQHGESVAAEVRRLLGLTFTPLTAPLEGRFKRIDLAFQPHFTRAQWEERAKQSGIVGYHAKKNLARLDRGEALPTHLPYPVQAWHFGDELALVFLGGEVVVDYSLRLKKEFDAARLWITAYANDVVCYIPSRRILDEGGYEAEGSLWYYDRPARLAPENEDLIIRTVRELLPASYAFDAQKAEMPPPRSPREALAAFQTHARLAIELVASEPLIESPVAIDWGADGRLWVCEMFDYPEGVPTAAGTRRPGGRIKVLADTDGDGRPDRATLFLDGLPFPTGVMPWRRGALVCAAPDILYAEDTDGDGRADQVQTNFTGFATHNFQARVNGFTWGLDGWLHGSSGLFGGKVKSLLTGREVDLSGRDFRFKPDTGDIEPVSGISQMGRVRDDFDHWFGNDNGTLLWHYPLPDHYLRRNPHVAYPHPAVPVTRDADSGRLFPISRTLERFNDPQAANRVTGACGPGLYRDDLLGTDYRGHAFVCEPVHNLVRRLPLVAEGASFASRRAANERENEFLASTDNWFRPVQARTGPDGALWIVDMYRFVVEHPRWIPSNRLVRLDVRAGADRGRIYRVYPKAARRRPVPDLTRASDVQLVAALNTLNGPVRDLAHAELLHRAAPAADMKAGLQAASAPPSGVAPERAGRTPITELAALVTRSSLPEVRAQALCILSTLGALEESEILWHGLQDPHPEVRRIAVRCAETQLNTWPSLAVALTRMAGLPATVPSPGREIKPESNLAVRMQLALSLGATTNALAAPALAGLMIAADGLPWLRAAAMSSAAAWSGDILERLLEPRGTVPDFPPVAEKLAELLVTTGNREDVARLLSHDVFSNHSEPGPVSTTLAAAVLHGIRRTHASCREYFGTEDRAEVATHALARQVQSARLGLSAALAGAGDAPAEPPSLWRTWIRLLGHEPREMEADVALLADLLGRFPHPDFREAVVERLGGLRSANLATALLQRWAGYGPSLRTRLLALLITREDWTGELLDALERGKVALAEIPLSERQRLLGHASQSIRQRAALLAPSPSAERSGVMARYAVVRELAGAPARGAAVFDQHCASCHALRGRGHEVGPNLGEFAGKSVEDFLVAILDPNAAINPNFVAYHVEVRDGRSLSGLVRGETASGLTLVQGGGVRETIRRADIAEIRASELSLMPEGLEQGLPPQDLADLIAWVRQSAPAPFGGAGTEAAAQARAEFLRAQPNGLARLLAAGDRLPYPSWMGRLPLAYCRQDEGMNRLAWQTAPVPAAPYSGATHRFRLAAATGFLSQPQGKFTLQVNGQRAFDFDVTLHDRTWSSADGRVRMSYTVMEANTEDSNGILELELAAGLLATDQPVTLEVIGSNARSQRWFGVYLVDSQ